jgi:hypothetical protein
MWWAVGRVVCVRACSGTQARACDNAAPLTLPYRPLPPRPTHQHTHTPRTRQEHIQGRKALRPQQVVQRELHAALRGGAAHGDLEPRGARAVHELQHAGARRHLARAAARWRGAECARVCACVRVCARMW